MKKKRGRPKIDPSIEGLIIAQALEKRDISRKVLAYEIQELIKQQGRNPPCLETISKRISRARSHPESPQDRHWDLSTLDEFPIPAEVLPTVIKVWFFNLEETDMPFTIREAKWVVRLYPFHDRIRDLAANAPQFSLQELVQELYGEPLVSWEMLNALLLRRLDRDKFAVERLNDVINKHPQLKAKLETGYLKFIPEGKGDIGSVLDRLAKRETIDFVNKKPKETKDNKV